MQVSKKTKKYCIKQKKYFFNVWYSRTDRNTFHYKETAITSEIFSILII